MERLVMLYYTRLQGVALETSEDLEHLLKHDEKKFYFALMFFFLTRKDLGDIIRMSPAVSAAVSIFCESCCDSQITEYFSQYVNLSEIAEQIGKIYNEMRMFAKREQILKSL